MNISKFWAWIGLLIVMIIIAAAVIFQDQIERYSMTGYAGVFIACFAATSTILLPAPGVLVVIQYAQFFNPLLVILLGGLGTSLGEMTGYLLGRSGKALAVRLFEGCDRAVSVRKFANIFNRMLNKRVYLTVFLFSIVPLPVFDIVGMTAGINKVNPILFWISCFCGKLIKMSIYVILFARVETLMQNLI